MEHHKVKKNSEQKKTIAVLFGGRSAEHEISIITALQVITAIDTLNYQVLPIYIHPTGKWYTGDSLLNKAFYRTLPDGLTNLQQITLIPDPSIKGVVTISRSGQINLNQVIPVDCYFLAFHGQLGEDGCIQGLLELAHAAYTGCNVAASAIAMHKYHCKMLLQGHGIPVLPSVLISHKECIKKLKSAVQHILQTPGLEKFPLIVKPCRLGSSIGISVAHDIPSLQAGLANVFRYDTDALIEPCVTKLLEINVAVLDGEPPKASVVEIPVLSGEILSYEDKYMRGGGKKSASQGMASLTRIINPTNLQPHLKQEVTEHALKAFQALGCSGVGRFDFIYDLSLEKLYFNELNPIPGSLSFYLWEKNSPPLLYTHLIENIIESALQRKAARLAQQTDLGFKALFL